MAISTQIPLSWKLPLFWATIDGSKAGNLTESQRALLVGQMYTSGASAGIQPINTPIPVGSVALAGNYFGVGSMAYRMVKEFFNCNTTQQLWAVGVPEPSAGTKAVGTITITVSSLASGVLTIYFAGQKVEINVASTDTPTIIAAALAAEINANLELPVVAVAALGVVTVTSQWKGETGNDITIIPNFLGPYGGERLPVGLTVVVVPMATGTGTVDFTAAISAIQTIDFDFLGLPFTDTGALTTWNTEYGFAATGRWNFTRQQYGIITTARRDTYAGMITWGLTQNSPVMSTMAVETTSPTPMWEWAAAYCAIAALGFSDDPARPLQTLEMPGLLTAPSATRFSQLQRNALVNSGLASHFVAPSGQAAVEREQTQYQLNSFGQGDTAFSLLTVLTTLQELLRRMKSAITSKYPRVKLVPDGTKLGPGQAAVMPLDIKGELVAEFSNAMFDGLVSNIKAFKANLIVEIDNNNPNRLNVLWPPQLAGQLRQFAALAQFRLLSPPVDVG